MPLINGMKMACEPCIRGHRSTKCTHANERLMVPVKKPGRPLSACPHLHNQLCGCSSVTAAIPRKQKCHCGTGVSAEPPPAVQSRPVSSTTSDIPSPTKVAFRIQKSPISSSRKQSFDPSSLDRMDVGNINIIPHQTSAIQPTDQALSNGHSTTLTYVSHTNGAQDLQSSAGTQNPLLQSQYPNLSIPINHSNETFLTRYPASRSSIVVSNNSYLQLEMRENISVAHVKASGGTSCCAAKPDISNEIVAFKPQSYERSESGSGSGSSGVASMSSGAIPETPLVNGQLQPQQYAFTDNFSTSQDVYLPFVPQTTIYAYPPSYGSYKHPLQPSEWRRGVISNIYAQPMLQPEMTDGLITLASGIIPNLDTFHTCSCGDACQCIGCAAHPYNDATQNYVRSAYTVAHEPSTSATIDLINGDTNGIVFTSTADSIAADTSGNSHALTDGEEIPPLHADTPSDSSTAEELTLPASDYFFVNYPFSSDGCGGDTTSCPCGDECECVGCTIHRFDESSSIFPSELWANEDIFTNVDGAEFANGMSVKDEHLIDEGAERPAKSCCG